MPYENFPDGIIIADAQGRVELANAWLRRWLGVSESDVVGRHLSETLPFDNLLGHTWFDTVRPYDGLAIRRKLNEQSWYAADGAEYLVTATLQRERPAGRVIRVIVSVRNAGNRRQIDRRRSDMVATVAHELRSPLTGIKGFSATLLSRWDAFTEDQRKFMLETIDADADRLSRLVTELLDAARIDAGRMTLRVGPVHLDELAGRVLTSAFATSGTKRAPDVFGVIPVVWGDEDRITQVLTNLIENAVWHGEGLDAVHVAAEERDGNIGVTLTVSDSGPGIPESLRDRVFSRFWRSGPAAGSGLGMFIVHGVVILHNGQISIADGPNGGAQITVWLPVNEPAALRD